MRKSGSDGKVASGAKTTPPNAGVVSKGKLWETAEFKKWMQEVQVKPAEEQVLAVSEKLKELNPQFDGKIPHYKIEDDAVTELRLTVKVEHLAPVRALARLKALDCGGAHDASLPESLVSDLAPLQGMQLSNLGVNHSRVTDLSPLAGMPLTRLGLWGTKVTDLSPLRGMPLEWLVASVTSIRDLSPLEGMPLRQLYMDVTLISDLSPLRKSSLEDLQCTGTYVADFSPLKELPLKRLMCDFFPKRDGASLRAIKTLQSVNHIPVAEIWKQVQEQETQPRKPLAFQMPGFDQWVKEVAAKPADEQLEAVRAKLVEINPGFDGKLYLNAHPPSGTPRIENGAVTELSFFTDHVTDLSPLRVFTGLRILTCDASDFQGILTDLSPLRGMPLTQLNIVGNRNLTELGPLQGMPLTHFDCFKTSAYDLAPLKGMALNHLKVRETAVVDLSPLQTMPLNYLDCYGLKTIDLSPLRRMKLTRFENANSQARDFTPLRGMPIEYLILSLTQIDDLSILEGMPLTSLELLSCPNISDITPLKQLPLRVIHIDFNPERDAKTLRAIKTLQLINGMPPEQFWKEFDEQRGN